MIGKVCKQFTFDAAHQLPGHKGKCARLHGHTYKLELFLVGPLGEEQGSSNQGFVVDFGDISDWVKTNLMPHIDHRFLNDVFWLDGLGDPLWGPAAQGEDRPEGVDNIRQSFLAWGWQPMRTTAELMSHWLFKFMIRKAPFGHLLTAVRLWETPTGYAECDLSCLEHQHLSGAAEQEDVMDHITPSGGVSDDE